jgi:hypothetical protein
MVRKTIKKISNTMKDHIIVKGLTHGSHKVTKVIRDENNIKIAVECKSCCARLTRHPIIEHRVQWSKVVPHVHIMK